VDIENVSTSGPFDLSVTTLERSAWYHASPTEYHFRLKEVLRQDRYDELWRRLNQTKGLQLLKSTLNSEGETNDSLHNVFIATSTMFGAAATQTLTGTITSMCRMGHKAMVISPNAKCVRECAKSRVKYVLVEGTKTYVLSDPKRAEQFAAQKVKVVGRLDGI
jgi:hypothetical protein